jgi:tRNA(Ile)-lysidine synthase
VQAAEAFDLDLIFAAVGDARHIAVAVSGGSDSMALLTFAWEHAHRVGAGLTALTFDHGLRAESADEARWVRDWCESRGLAHRMLNWVGPKPVTGIQAAARKARYDALTAEVRRIGADVLLTGHTSNDQAETYLMRKARSNSAISLASILPEINWDGVRIVRPLLGLKREPLREMLRARNIDWLEDPSNDNEKFERVRVRNALDESLIEQFVVQAQEAQLAAAHDRQLVADWRKTISKDKYGVLRFSRDGFLALPEAAQHEALKTAFQDFAARAGQNVTAGERGRLLHWIAGTEEGRRTLGHVVFSVLKGNLTMMRELVYLPCNLVPESGKLLWDGRFVIEAPVGARVVAQGRTQHFRRDPSIPALVQKSLPLVLVNDEPIFTNFDCVQALEFATEAPMLATKVQDRALECGSERSKT